MIKVHRSHEFHMGHRVYQHEGKCAHMHGHAYFITFHCHAPELDAIGRVMDFSVMKDLLVNWVEDNWDHKFMVYERDPLAKILMEHDPLGAIVVPFNPTAENIASFFLSSVGPTLLEGTGVKLVSIELMETQKCGVTAELTTGEPDEPTV